jgi:hypothetical protein
MTFFHGDVVRWLDDVVAARSDAVSGAPGWDAADPARGLSAELPIGRQPSLRLRVNDLRS